MHEYSQKILTLLRSKREDVNMGIELLRSVGPVVPEIATDLLTLSDPWNSNRLPSNIPNRSELILEMVGWILDTENPSQLVELQKIETIPVVNVDVIPSKLDRLYSATIDLTGATISDEQYTLCEEVFNGSMRLAGTSLPKFEGVFNRVSVQGRTLLSVVSQWKFTSLLYTDRVHTVEFTNAHKTQHQERCMALCTDLRSNTTPEKLLSIASRNGFTITKVDVAYNRPTGEVWKSWVHNRPTLPIKDILARYPDLKHLNLGYCVWSPDLSTIDFDTNHPIERIEWRQSLFCYSLPQYLQFSSQNDGPTLRERLVAVKVFTWTEGLGRFSNLQHVILLDSWVHTTLHIPSLSDQGRIEQQSCLGDLVSRIQHIPDDSYGDNWGNGRYFGYEQTDFFISGEADCLAMLGLKYPRKLNRKGSRLSCLQYLLLTSLGETYDFSILLPTRNMTWFVQGKLRELVRTPRQQLIWRRLFDTYLRLCNYDVRHFETYSEIWHEYQVLSKNNISIAIIQGIFSHLRVAVRELSADDRRALVRLHNVGITLVPQHVLVWDWTEYLAKNPNSERYVEHLLSQTLDRKNRVRLRHIPLIEKMREVVQRILQRKYTKYLRLTETPSIDWLPRLAELFESGVTIVWNERSHHRIKTYLSECPEIKLYILFIAMGSLNDSVRSLCNSIEGQQKLRAALPLLMNHKHKDVVLRAIQNGTCESLSSWYWYSYSLSEDQMLALLELYQQDVHILPGKIDLYRWRALHKKHSTVLEYLAFVFQHRSKLSKIIPPITNSMLEWCLQIVPLKRLKYWTHLRSRTIRLSSEAAISKKKIVELYARTVKTVPSSIDVFDWLRYCEEEPDAWLYVHQVLLPRCTKADWTKFWSDAMDESHEYSLVLKVCARLTDYPVLATKESQQLLLRLHQDDVTVVCSPFDLSGFRLQFGEQADAYSVKVLEYWMNQLFKKKSQTAETLFALVYHWTYMVPPTDSVIPAIGNLSSDNVIAVRAPDLVCTTEIQQSLVDLHLNGCTIYLWHESHIMNWIQYVEENPDAESYVRALIEHIFQQRPYETWRLDIGYCLERICEQSSLTAFYLEIIAYSNGCTAGIVEQLRNRSISGEIENDTTDLFNWLKIHGLIRDWYSSKLVCFNVSSSIVALLLGNLSSEIEHIELNYCNLADLPVELRQFSHLKRLMVYGNRLESLPEWIGEMTKLEYLSISSNPLTSLPKGIRQLKHLKRVYVKNVQMSAEAQEFIESLSV